MPGQTREDRRRTDAVQAGGNPANEGTTSSKAVVPKLLKIGEASGGRSCDGKRMCVRFFGDFTSLKKILGLEQPQDDWREVVRWRKECACEFLRPKNSWHPRKFLHSKKGLEKR